MSETFRITFFPGFESATSFDIPRCGPAKGGKSAEASLLFLRNSSEHLSFPLFSLVVARLPTPESTPSPGRVRFHRRPPPFRSLDLHGASATRSLPKPLRWRRTTSSSRSSRPSPRTRARVRGSSVRAETAGMRRASSSRRRCGPVSPCSHLATASQRSKGRALTAHPHAGYIIMVWIALSSSVILQNAYIL